MSSSKISASPQVRLLAIESSTTICSVALSSDDTILASREINDGYRHASLLTHFIREVLEEAGFEASDLSAVAVSKGPGSYTGLRIGVSAAKGVCFACNIPLIGVTALEAIAWKLAADCLPDDLLMPMIDAGRMEVYTAVYDAGLQLLAPVEAKIIHPEILSHLRPDGNIILAGNGAAKCREMFSSNPHYIIKDEVLPSATLLVPPALTAFRMQRFENLAYFEPFYLKNFIAGKPRVKGLQ